MRQPFPGPGLAIRIIGEITKEKADILRSADAIFREEIAAAGLDRSINQYFAVLTNMRSVGVMCFFLSTFDFKGEDGRAAVWKVLFIQCMSSL